jgi:LysR family glycine cleavage system transcriptional activator
VSQALPRVDAAVRQIRQSAGRKTVSLTTFASFASMWLIPRLEAFQRDHPDIDIRIDASDVAVDLDVADVDIALRYGPASSMPPVRCAVWRTAHARGQPLAAQGQPACARQPTWRSSP